MGGSKQRSPGRLLAAVGALVTALALRSPASGEELVPLARDLPWPHVSQIIGYDGRVWFANSLKYVNHNSADLYSWDPATRRLRYERHLFSQDAGDPAVWNGLLYWPFEDSRWSPGRGEFMVTDGRRWRWGLLPEGRAFHLHAMAAVSGALYAAPSAWRAHLQRSLDGGTTWRTVYRHPSPEGTVNRLVALAGLGGTLFAGLTAWHDPASPKLLRWTGDTMRPVSGWPAGGSVPTLVSHDGWLYGRNVTEGKGSVWRTDGRRVQAISALDGLIVRDLAAGRGPIWAVSADTVGGALWRSADGLDWRRVQVFEGPQPVSVGVVAGHVFVGVRDGEHGMLLGPADGFDPEPRGETGKLPRGRPEPAEAAEAALARLDGVLADGARYDGMRAAARPLALSDDPRVGAALAERLRTPKSAGSVSLFGGALRVSAKKFANWYLLWAMGHVGHGRVPVRLLEEPWTEPSNRAEKYLDAPPGAAWTVAEIGQDDEETLAALIGRLDRDGDPLWLRGDMVGALTALTGERLGYDAAAWRAWWAARPH